MIKIAEDNEREKDETRMCRGPCGEERPLTEFKLLNKRFGTRGWLCLTCRKGNTEDTSVKKPGTLDKSPKHGNSLMVKRALQEAADWNDRNRAKK